MTTLKAQRAAEVAANKAAAFHKKAASLLGHVRYSKLEADRAHHDGRSADDFAAEIAAREPVGKAVHAVKADAVEAAEQMAREVVERVRAELEAGGWDINAIAPYPSSMRETRADFQRKQAKYQLFHGLTKTREGTRYSGMRGETHLVEIADHRVEKFVDDTRQRAALDYDAFIVKLVAKIGAGAVDAALIGNHVWDHSVLTVIREDGSSEHWQTQQIRNYSVYGTPYAQWPTRLLKGRKA